MTQQTQQTTKLLTGVTLDYILNEMMCSSYELVDVSWDDKIETQQGTDALWVSILNNNWDKLYEYVNETVWEQEALSVSYEINDLARRYAEILGAPYEIMPDGSKWMYREECYNYAVFDDETEQIIRDTIYDRNKSDPVRELVKNTGPLTMGYQIGEVSDYCVDYDDRVSELLSHLPNIDPAKYDKEIRELLDNSYAGGELSVFFDLDPAKWIDSPPPQEIKFENPTVGLVDRFNGSGHNVTFQGYTIEFTLFELIRFYWDDFRSYSYANDICGGMSDWCETTVHAKRDNKCWQY